MRRRDGGTNESNHKYNDFFDSSRTPIIKKESIAKSNSQRDEHSPARLEEYD